MKISEAVAKRTRDLLEKKKMTQYRLCKDLAMHPRTMATIMAGENKAVNLKTVLLFSRGLGITAAEFLNDPIFENADLDIE